MLIAWIDLIDDGAKWTDIVSSISNVIICLAAIFGVYCAFSWKEEKLKQKRFEVALEYYNEFRMITLNASVISLIIKNSLTSKIYMLKNKDDKELIRAYIADIEILAQKVFSYRVRFDSCLNSISAYDMRILDSKVNVISGKYIDFLKNAMSILYDSSHGVIDESIVLLSNDSFESFQLLFDEIMVDKEYISKINIKKMIDLNYSF
ncbi:hypothetical protein [Yersinia mollaretii]|uniref:hypothetical protein n=1 Tax=Yersinia mollaretii TaxID=33060 RepID=UPI0005DD67C2|nr:hypothetical protein [Yersinia mollaretii]CNF01117.1 Uncharacterised protein [Yersinia mollaretii]